MSRGAITSTIKLVPIDLWTEKFNSRLTKGTTTITPDAPVKPVTMPANTPIKTIVIIELSISLLAFHLVKYLHERTMPIVARTAANIPR